MKHLYLILLLALSTLLEAGKITWSEDGKPNIAQSQKQTEGCKANDLLASLNDNNQSLTSVDNNLSTLCT